VITNKSNYYYNYKGKMNTETKNEVITAHVQAL